MIRYNYKTEDIISEISEEKDGIITIKHDIISKKVIREVMEIYPNKSILDKNIRNNKSTKIIINNLNKVYEGMMESVFVKIEDKWYDIQLEIQNIEENNDIENNSLNDELIILKNKRDELENSNPWLKAYRGEETEAVRPEPSENVKITEEDLKKLIAHDINSKVRNNEDSIADIAKMNSLLFSMVSSMYEVMPLAEKDLIPAEEKALIDYATTAFATVQTRADRQLLEEGTALVDKLFAREVQIADIIDAVKA